MVRLLPQMSEEAPPGYVAFVERHLEPLRRAAARITGDDHDPGEIYSAVLTDVAARWRRLELIRSVLGRSILGRSILGRSILGRSVVGRPDPAEAYLERAVARRCADWHEPLYEYETRIEVWAADRPPPAPVPLSPEVSLFSGGAPPTLQRESAAVRLARARPPPLATASAVAEAAIAWCHAYEAYLRHRRIAGGVAALLFFVLIYGAHFRPTT